ncbi:MAG: DUF3857 domain-containing protein [Prolixibacteraceae bacterium]|nr:DUF3857 domain-containing protein [Prolixibacteraceae bacterium]
MKQYFLMAACAIFISTGLYARKTNDIDFNIPDSLLDESKAVYLFHNTTYTRQSKSVLIEECHFAVTILSDRGDYFTEFEYIYDKFSAIKKIECSIYDASGKHVRKIKNKEIKDYSAYDGFSLFSDNRFKEFKALYPSYPYTIEVKIIKRHDGFIGIPSWYPLKGYHQSVKETSVTLKFPPELPIKFKENNIGRTVKNEFDEKKIHGITWKATGLKPIKPEKFSPAFFNQVASVSFAPGEFEYDNSEGSLNDWKSFGLWKHSLLDDDFSLSPKTIEKLEELKEKYPGKKELTKQVFKYMQGRTRYVSIQLGIGGFKPFSPEVVDDVGYGDCKALSYYTKSLLGFVGIPSIYTTIGVNSRKIVFEDFANVNQSNHVILCVPFETDTVWLECTSQTIPFNHLFSGETGRKALLIKPEGGELVYIPEPVENKKKNIALIKLNEDDEFICEISTHLTGSFYDDEFSLLQLSDKELNEKLTKESGISDITLYDAEVVQNENIPEITITKKFRTKNLASKAGSRYILDISPFLPVSSFAEQRNPRRNPVYIKEKLDYIDEITFEIPNTLSVEHCPENKIVSSEFGSYSTQISVVENTITLQQHFTLLKGKHPVEKYTDFIDFINQIAETSNLNIILKK